MIFYLISFIIYYYADFPAVSMFFVRVSAAHFGKKDVLVRQ
ncbi:hypothetical protein B4168_1838 [Anoxybacillus flavithermus]|nr:hypothetical protein B4168_1838 [Anoxybacillus flavithermus]OAO85493.1 hypothetical protein GT23_2396 [Parageobacillus thermoglucosidasius]